MNDEDLANYWDDEFRNETAGDDWSRTAQSLRADLNAIVPDGGRLVAYECKATLCKVELEYSDKFQHNAFVRSLFADPDSPVNGAFAGFMTTRTHESESAQGARMQGFLVRKGRMMVPQ